MKSLHGATILIVEADDANSRLLSTVLALAGARIRSAHTAEEAEALLSRWLPDAMVIDVVLPGLDGVGLISRVKSTPATRGIVCIAVSALNGRESERAAMEAGGAAYTRMPIDTETFAALVARQLGGKT